jgi:hypothetical protein
MGQIRPNNAYLGMNLDSIINQVKPGQVTYAQNAQTVGFEGNMIVYQNEQGNQICFTVPEGYRVIGTHDIVEKDIILLFLVNITTGASEIGKVVGCTYSTIINATCLNFNINNPIQKVEHKITNCSTEVYWTDGLNHMRFIDLDNLPYKEVVQGNSANPCDVTTTTEIDCNKLSVRPNFSIPMAAYRSVESEGTTIAGTYQFAIQYTNSLGEAYTAYYSVTNPIPIYDPFIVTPNFDYPVGRSIVLDITDIDTTGVFDFINVAVIKTINNISSVDIVGTYQIQGSRLTITYTGQSKAGVTGAIDEIFEKFPIYDTAEDLTTVNDILIYAGLTSTERLNYQRIASQISLQWVTYKMPPEKKQYRDELNSASLRGYMRDEVYAFDIVFILKNGYQTDRFHIPGRKALPSDLTPISNRDSVFEDDVCTEPTPKPRWQVYNTATVLGIDPAYNPTDRCYQGPYQFGTFSYWESTETYPCNEPVWGDLQGQRIRHPKFPDSSITHHHDADGNIYPIGIRFDVKTVLDLIKNSDLTQEQKDNIAAFKIVRGNRANSKSVIAKGLLYNVGRYSKENSTYYYPNYPFNDLRADPFLTNAKSTDVGAQIFSSFEDKQSASNVNTEFYSALIPSGTWKTDGDIVTVVMDGSFAGNSTPKRDLSLRWDGSQVYISPFLNNMSNANSYTLTIQMKRINSGRIDLTNKLQIFGQNPQTLNSTGNIVGIDFTQVHTISLFGKSFDIAPPPLAQDGDIITSSAVISYKPAPSLNNTADLLEGFNTTESQLRYTMHSPDLAFYQPFLGTQLKLESVEYGTTRSHFTQVDKHAKYRFPSLDSYLVALGVGIAIGFASGTYGVSTNPFNGAAAFTAFQVFNDIVFRLLPRKNMTYSFNSLGDYSTPKTLPNDTGNKIRMLDIASYLISGIQGVGDIHVVNNYQRESSVYLRTTDTLPYPDSIQGIPADNSRFTLGEMGCNEQFYTRNISSYYSSIKNIVPDQYGQIYSYEAVDTGFQSEVNLTAQFAGSSFRYVFGGDTFINKFALKRKLPFFIDNKVNFADDSDVFYDELGNIGYPRYWFSTDVKRGNGGSFNIGSLFGVKVNNFDCENSNFFYNAGKIYLFAYGIINFFVESQVNVDLRQAYNNKEGDYFPHVGGDVPDQWLQEANVPIAYDNTYTYNKTFSKQNIENVFTTLPVDFNPNEKCTYNFPNRAIYSERQQDTVNYKKNNWRIYRPAALFDFPLNYGKLTAVDGIETKQLLVRFESRAQLYNSLLTTTSSLGEVYLGQQMLNPNVPPVDFASTDQGYTGSQHKFILNTEFGHLWIDAKRGDVFLLGGAHGITDISNEGAKLFLTNNLPFQLKEFFPDYDIDNNFKGVGLHGTYDNKYNRVLITKLDYKPIINGITYNSSTDVFSLGDVEIELGDPDYFCDISFTISYSFISKSWISFHSYLPHYYIGGISTFHTGRNDLGSAWLHNLSEATYNTFYGNIEPYIIETPFAYQFQDEILQSVKDYSKVNKMVNAQTYVQTNDIFFNKAWIYNDQQFCAINLVPKPKNNLSAYLQYPKINSDSMDVLFVKSDNFYNYNGFWDVVEDYDSPIFLQDCTPNTENKVPNTTNLAFTGKTFKKYPIRAKDCRIRHILDNRSDVRITSQLLATETQTSYK